MDLLEQAVREILTSEELDHWQKVDQLWKLFGVRPTLRNVTHFFSQLLMCSEKSNEYKIEKIMEWNSREYK